MQEYKLLTYGRLSAEFESHIRDRYPEIKITRPRSRQEITAKFGEVNVVAGFDFLEDEDMSSIKWIHSFGAGVDSFLKKIDRFNTNLLISRTTGKLGDKIGEYCMTYVLAHLKHLFSTYQHQQEKKWIQLPGENLFDKKVLIIGTGSIGQGIATAFKNKVKLIAGANRTGKVNGPFDAVYSWIEMDIEKEKFDIVISALPNTPHTQNILDKKFFANFKNALFLNIGRGDSVNEQDLVDALEHEHLEKVVLDVFKEEPLSKESKLWEHNKVVITPHQAGLTTIEEVMESFDLAYQAMRNKTKNNLFIDLENGY